MKHRAPKSPSVLNRKRKLLASKANRAVAVSSQPSAESTPLPTQKQLQDRLDMATVERIPHYFWPLPEWTNQKPQLEDNVSDAPVFSQPTNLNCDILLKARITELKNKFPGSLGHVNADRGVENSLGGDSDDPLTQVPHPESDFAHVDPGVYTAPEKQDFLDAIERLKRLEGRASDDGEMAAAFKQAGGPLLKAKGLLAEQPKGAQRLRLLFEWSLCQATTFFSEINAALDKDPRQGKSDYNAARDKYLALLRDLDDAEPKTQGPGVNGYGRSIKWTYILPLIHEGRIKGAKVVAKWNPHISSSGIPIAH